MRTNREFSHTHYFFLSADSKNLNDYEKHFKTKFKKRILRSGFDRTHHTLAEKHIDRFTRTKTNGTNPFQASSKQNICFLLLIMNTFNAILHSLTRYSQECCKLVTIAK